MTNYKLGRWELNMKVVLKRRTTDLGVSHLFPRILGDTWPKRRGAYIIGIIPEKKVLVLESATKTGRKSIIDVPTDAVRRHPEQPKWTPLSKKSVKIRRNMKLEDEALKRLRKEQQALEKLARLKRKREEQELEVLEDEPLVLTTVADLEAVEVAPLETKTESTLLDETLESEIMLAKKILKIIKEHNLGIPKKGITETTVSQFWRKFKDRNHKKRIVSKINKLLQGRELKPETNGIEYTEEDLYRLVKGAECIMYRQVDSICCKFISQLGYKASPAVKRAVVKRINKFLKN